MNLYLLSVLIEVFLQPFLVAPGGQTRECIEFVPLRTHLAFHHSDYGISFLSSRLRVLLLPLNIPCLSPVAQMVSFPHHAGISRLLLPLERAHATVWRLTDSAAQLFRDVNLPLNASQSIHRLSCDAHKAREKNAVTQWLTTTCWPSRDLWHVREPARRRATNQFGNVHQSRGEEPRCLWHRGGVSTLIARFSAQLSSVVSSDGLSPLCPSAQGNGEPAALTHSCRLTGRPGLRISSWSPVYEVNCFSLVCLVFFF